MESVESKLFDLLEIFSFEQLDSAQKSFVLQNMTQEEFRAQQKIMVAAGLIEFSEVTPLPLVVTKKKAAGLLIPIPLYKILTGAAATFLSVWFCWPTETNEGTQIIGETNIIRDTIFVTKIQHDTIRLYVEKPLLSKNEKAPDTVYIYEKSNNQLVSQRMLEPAENQPNIVLNDKTLKTKGTPIKDDETMNLLPSVQAFGL